MLFSEIVIIGVLLLIFIQDIRRRSVYWVLFPILAGVFILLHIVQHHLFTDVWQAVLINSAFLIIQFLVVLVYFSIKNKHWVNITEGLLGWGDILLLLSLAFYLSALNFLLFYISSLIVSLLIWLFWQLLSKEKNKHIPLAGFQSLIFTVFLAGDWWFKYFDLTNDSWLLYLITK
ncbi:MAG: hypothetical protein ACHQIM_04405 [Sphingobacteriales bacterium]